MAGKDPIVEEIHAVREAMVREPNYSIVKSWRQHAHGRPQKSAMPSRGRRKDPLQRKGAS
jgi:hypothetical protein